MKKISYNLERRRNYEGSKREKNKRQDNSGG